MDIQTLVHDGKIDLSAYDPAGKAKLITALEKLFGIPDSNGEYVGGSQIVRDMFVQVISGSKILKFILDINPSAVPNSFEASVGWGSTPPLPQRHHRGSTPPLFWHCRSDETPPNAYSPFITTPAHAGSTRPARISRWTCEYGQSAARSTSPCFTGLIQQ
jgi:hypothetical protein